MKKEKTCYWVARDKSGCLTMHLNKPTYSEGADLWKSDMKLCTLPKENHKVVTFENSPWKVSLFAED